MNSKVGAEVGRTNSNTATKVRIPRGGSTAGDSESPDLCTVANGRGCIDTKTRRRCVTGEEVAEVATKKTRTIDLGGFAYSRSWSSKALFEDGAEVVGAGTT